MLHHLNQLCYNKQQKYIAKQAEIVTTTVKQTLIKAIKITCVCVCVCCGFVLWFYFFHGIRRSLQCESPHTLCLRMPSHKTWSMCNYAIRPIPGPAPQSYSSGLTTTVLVLTVVAVDNSCQSAAAALSSSCPSGVSSGMASITSAVGARAASMPAQASSSSMVGHDLGAPVGGGDVVLGVVKMLMTSHELDFPSGMVGSAV